MVLDALMFIKGKVDSSLHSEGPVERVFVARAR